MIKYPNGVIKTSVQRPERKVSSLTVDSYKNRGMSLENEINLTLTYFKDKNLALMQKRTTPINVVQVDYAKGAVITKAYFEKQSSTDYNGVYKGKYVDFEAKSTLQKTSLPIANISSHQIDHLKQVIALKGIAFFIIEFQSFQRVYLVKAEDIIRFMDEEKRKSLPYSWIVEHGHLIPEGLTPRFNFLPILDRLFF
jgi:recombination protein U